MATLPPVLAAIWLGTLVLVAIAAAPLVVLYLATLVAVAGMAAVVLA